MLEGRPFLILLVGVGTLFGVIPIANTELLPAWAGTALAVTPVALLVFGGGAVADGSGRVGTWVERAGALGYLGLVGFAGFWALRSGATGEDRFGALGALVGVPVALWVLVGSRATPRPPALAGLLDERDRPPTFLERLEATGSDILGLGAISATFVAVGVFLLLRGDPGAASIAVICIVFFGAGLPIAASRALDRWALLDPPNAARLHRSASLLLHAGAVLFLVGLLLMAAWPEAPAWVRGLSGTCGLVGSAALTMKLLGLTNHPTSVRVEATRVVITRRRDRIVVPKDHVLRVSLVEFQGNLGVGFDLDWGDAPPLLLLSAESDAPASPRRHARLLRSCRWTRAFQGADLVLLRAQLDRPPGELLEEIGRRWVGQG